MTLQALAATCRIKPAVKTVVRQFVVKAGAAARRMVRCHLRLLYITSD